MLPLMLLWVGLNFSKRYFRALPKVLLNDIINEVQ